jgi:S1-C subfamily serine protease
LADSKKQAGRRVERIVISPDEVAQTVLPAVESPGLAAKLPPPIPWWAKLSLFPLVLVLPVLCLVAILLRVATRGLPPRTRHAWVAFMATLLTVSGMITSVAVVVFFTLAPPAPSTVSEGLSELDSRTLFPALPASTELTAEAVSDQLKPIVVVITPARQNWFSHVDGPSNSFGAGVLLQANKDGYLIATARHVIDADLASVATERALVASNSGTWAGADVVARHQNLDLLLLWLPRREGDAAFTLPVLKCDQLKGGESIFVIGHPQGLRFTLSTGIVSRRDQETIQISAPISPGDSGGPLFNTHGQLAGIVTSMVDKNNSPNAENLNFAVCADPLLEPSGWNFSGDGRRRLTSFEQSQNANPR